MIDDIAALKADRDRLRDALTELDRLLDFSDDIDDRHPLTEICFAGEINRTWAKAREALKENKG